NGRTLPRLSWLSLIAQNKAGMLLNNDLITKDFYGLKNDSQGSLEVYALGPGFVLLNNQYIDAWEGHLPRLLFFFALDRPVITRSDICTSFWPELNPEQAVNVFHVTKRRLHKALDLDVLAHDDGYYAVNPELHIYYDVLEFVESLLRGRDASLDEEIRIDAWQRSANLYRGPFLQGHDDRWILERRIDFRAGYVESLQYMANVWKERNRPEQALSLLQKALTEDLRVDSVNQEIMRLYTSLGRRNEAAAHYQRVLEDYHKDGKQPSDALHEVYQEVTA
ncbi:MAG TPA: BTAD domain-containing putative transcriptional regulator, partial [Phototrophicaceae bacterium]|nr:BTAD domain-containing putative transcriptional regulator [Phototrophicaceae bacterium]